MWYYFYSSKIILITIITPILKILLIKKEFILYIWYIKKIEDLEIFFYKLKIGKFLKVYLIWMIINKISFLHFFIIDHIIMESKS